MRFTANFVAEFARISGWALAQRDKEKQKIWRKKRDLARIRMTLAEWEWRAVAPKLQPLHLPRARSDDLVVPKLPACGCEWWWRLVSPSTGGDWWATCHDESSTVPGTVDSNVASECHLCCPPPLPTEEVSSLDGSWGLCASPLNWKKEKRKVVLACPCLFPLIRGTEWGPGRG